MCENIFKFKNYFFSTGNPTAYKLDAGILVTYFSGLQELTPVSIQGITCFHSKHFKSIQWCLFYMKNFLNCCPKSILLSYFTDTQTKDKILVTQFKVVIQHCKIRHTTHCGTVQYYRRTQKWYI